MITTVSKLVSSYGGEEGIRTLETLLTPTRFPIVRLRPAQPPLHAQIIEISLNIIPDKTRFVKCFSRKSVFLSQGSICPEIPTHFHSQAVGILILILDSNIESRILCATHTRIVRMHAAPSHAESDAPLAL